MVLAGETIIAGKIPGERRATTIRNVGSATATTLEIVVDTVIAPVVIGRIYRVRWIGNPQSTVVNDTILVRLREDSLVGVNFQIVRSHIAQSGNFNFPEVVEAEYTADATEDKTFVATIIRSSGTGTISAAAASTQPGYLYVDYIRGP